MRVLMLYAHPVETSYAAALRDAALRGLSRHQVDLCDLYAEGFDPVMTRAERLGYHDPGFDRAAVAPWLSRLLAAEALVIVSPVWNFGYPAILKGFFDRVFLPRATFALDRGRVVPGAVRLRALAAVHSYGATRLGAWLAGDPPRTYATRVLRRLLCPAGPVRYLAQYGMNRATAADRARFLTRVEMAMGGL